MTVEGVIEAFIEPLLRISQDGGQGWKSYFALVAQVNNTPAWGGETMARFFDPVVHRLVDTLKIVRPDAQHRDLYWSYQFLTGSMMLALSETGRIDSLSDGAVPFQRPGGGARPTVRLLRGRLRGRDRPRPARLIPQPSQSLPTTRRLHFISLMKKRLAQNLCLSDSVRQFAGQ